MISARMLDHAARIYVFAETTEADTRARRNSYAAQAADERIAITPLKWSAANQGAGNRKIGTVNVLLRPGAVLVERDVISVTSGPNSPVKLEVISVERPRGHHTEAMCAPFVGSLT